MLAHMSFVYRKTRLERDLFTGGNLEVLHPGSHWADPDQQVLGPSRQVLGASGSWGVEAGAVP